MSEPDGQKNIPETRGNKKNAEPKPRDRSSNCDLFCFWRRLGARGHTMRNDLILDLVVGSLRHDLLGYQFILGSIRTASDDGFGVSVANSGQCFQLIFVSRVDVELVPIGSSFVGRCSGSGLVCLGRFRRSRPLS